jgi:hypothetical protein
MTKLSTYTLYWLHNLAPEENPRDYFNGDNFKVIGHEYGRIDYEIREDFEAENDKEAKKKIRAWLDNTAYDVQFFSVTKDQGKTILWTEEDFN